MLLMNRDAAGGEKPKGPGRQAAGENCPGATQPGEHQPSEAATSAFSTEPGGHAAGRAVGRKRNGGKGDEPHRLQLVDLARGDPSSGSGPEQPPSTPGVQTRLAEHPEQDPHLQAAARLMQAIEDEVELLRRGAGTVVPIQSSTKAQRFGARAGLALWRFEARLRRFAKNRLPFLIAVVGLALAARPLWRRKSS
jgi:hypothetical protein